MSPDPGFQPLPSPHELGPLLAPLGGLGGGAPAGPSLRYDGLYDRIREARRQDDPSLPQGVWKASLKRADWSRVAALCREALATRSKDLQAAVWLLEAWFHLHGLPGFTRGVEVVRGLCEAFWDDLHPQPEGDDLEYRLAPLEWLDERLPLELKLVQVTQPEARDAAPCTFLDWENAGRLENLALKDPEAVREAQEEGAVTKAKFLAGVALTPTSFYAVLAADVKRAAQAVDALGSALATRCGRQAPSFQRVHEVLGAAGQLAGKFLAERPDHAGPEAHAADIAGAAAGEEPAATGAGAASAPGGRIASRADAYRRLTEAAEYLLRTEPHSPAPYLVKRAVAWGGMSLAELLVELLQHNNDLKTIYNLLGIREGQQ